MIRKLLIPDSLLICIGCQAFITGVLTNTLALSDIVAITNLKLVPYVSPFVQYNFIQQIA